MSSPSFQLGTGFQMKEKGIHIVPHHIPAYGVQSSSWSVFLTPTSQYYISPIIMLCKPFKPSCECVLPLSVQLWSQLIFYGNCTAIQWNSNSDMVEKRGTFLHLFMFCLLRFCSTFASLRLILLFTCVAVSWHWPCPFFPGLLSLLTHIFKFRKAELKTVFGKRKHFIYTTVCSVSSMLFLATIIFLFDSVGMFSLDYWGWGGRSFQWATQCDAEVFPE